MLVIPCESKPKKMADGCAFVSIPDDYVVSNRVGCIVSYNGVWYAGCCELPFGFHEHTIEEEVRTIANRHLQDTPMMLDGGCRVDGFYSVLGQLQKLVGYCERTPFRELLENKPSSKKRRYKAGYAIYVQMGVRKQHGRIQMMPKLEFFPIDKLSTKEDRAIQFRSVVYNTALGMQLTQVEHGVYYHARNADGTPCIVKGYSNFERAMLLDYEARQYADPVFILADHSRFDAHVNPRLLAAEHGFYLAARGNNAELRYLLKMQKKNRGFSAGGIVYKMEGKRMSGDYNTALGNSLLNYAMMKSVFDCRGITKFNLIIDGDDSVVILEAAELRKCDNLADDFEDFGMTTEIEVAYDISQAEFCQCRIVYTKYGPCMVRNPDKSLGLMGVSPRQLDPQFAMQWQAAKALCEICSNPGVPVIQPYARKLLLGTGMTPEKAREYNFTAGDDQWKKLQTDVDLITWNEITEEARYSFWKAWGIHPLDQVLLEDAKIVWNHIGAREQKHKVPKDSGEYDYDDTVRGSVERGYPWIAHIEQCQLLARCFKDKNVEGCLLPEE